VSKGNSEDKSGCKQNPLARNLTSVVFKIFNMELKEKILKRFNATESGGMGKFGIEGLTQREKILLNIAIDETENFKNDKRSVSEGDEKSCKICNDTGWLNELERCICVRKW